MAARVFRENQAFIKLSRQAAKSHGVDLRLLMPGVSATPGPGVSDSSAATGLIGIIWTGSQPCDPLLHEKIEGGFYYDNCPALIVTFITILALTLILDCKC
jgi:hypothetical protein